ncbi:hypothetical protein D8674_008712 [Pyrus ussuriensis x Pyrus communis]|uniref:Uncharacterized protein n=1 Tax=Pyrus ussuriensis x Pyrus communis TaxID=2448454 RepID=A0A5N5HWL1_9ROSA|nr:hypothetical protein D8674_008712 [Pyrus ussuriensis x Pyrus communis]
MGRVGHTASSLFLLNSLGVLYFTFNSCKLWGWRCRTKLVIRGSPENPLIGLYQEGIYNVVDFPQCKAHHPSINAAVELLKQVPFSVLKTQCYLL